MTITNKIFASLVIASTLLFSACSSTPEKNIGPISTVLVVFDAQQSNIPAKSRMSQTLVSSMQSGLASEGLRVIDLDMLTSDYMSSNAELSRRDALSIIRSDGSIDAVVFISSTMVNENVSNPNFSKVGFMLQSEMISSQGSVIGSESSDISVSVSKQCNQSCIASKSERSLSQAANDMAYSLSRAMR